MGRILSHLLKWIPVILKWIIQIGPLLWEATKWVIRICKELKKKTPSETGGTRPVDKKLDPG